MKNFAGVFVRSVVIVAGAAVLWLMVTGSLTVAGASFLERPGSRAVGLIAIVLTILIFDFYLCIQQFIRPLSKDEQDDTLERKINIGLPYGRVFDLCRENLGTQSWQPPAGNVHSLNAEEQPPGIIESLRAVFRPVAGTSRRYSPVSSSFETGTIRYDSRSLNLHFALSKAGTDRTVLVVKAAYDPSNRSWQMFSYPVQRRRNAIRYLELIGRFFHAFDKSNAFREPY